MAAGECDCDGEVGIKPLHSGWVLVFYPGAMETFMVAADTVS